MFAPTPSLTYTHPSFILTYLMCMSTLSGYMYVFCLYTCTSYEHTVPLEIGGGVWMPRTGVTGAAMWVLGIEPGSSARTTLKLNLKRTFKDQGPETPRIPTTFLLTRGIQAFKLLVIYKWSCRTSGARELGFEAHNPPRLNSAHPSA